MGYTLLKMEKVPEVLKNKPQWVSCVAFATAILMIISSAIIIGVFIGYTYCYIENKAGFVGNVTQSTKVIMRLPYPEFEEKIDNRTINGAIMSSMLISRILTISQNLMEEEISVVPKSNEEANNP